MDFNQLMVKMREMDQPATEACGDPMGMPPAPMNQQIQPPPAHPSMTVNLNAQGLDNIEQMMKLFQKVNPDMMPKADMPTSTISNPVLKMLPPTPGVKKLDTPDMLNKPMPKEEEFANSAKDSSDTEYKDVDSVLMKGNDIHKPKGTYPKVSGGDNPMQRMEGQELVDAIRETLQAELSKFKNQ
jgi:hypothetical protein